ncbi:uncharacterized protein O3C94_007881 [Discoglossus pictus]
MDSDGESSPWDSPLSSARDPARRAEQQKVKSPISDSPWDSDLEKSTAARNVQHKDAQNQRNDGPWHNANQSNSRISEEENKRSVSRKSTPGVKPSPKVPPFSDFREALPALPEKELAGRGVAAPKKHPKGSVYTISHSEQEPSSWDQEVRDPQPPTLSTLTSDSIVYDSVPPPDITFSERAANERRRSDTPHSERQLTGQSDRERPNSEHHKSAGERTGTKGRTTEKQEVKEPPKYANHGWENEPVYMDAEQVWERDPRVSLVTELASYKDERHMYQFDYGHRQYYQARKDLNEPYMEKLADRSEKMILRCWREVFGVLRILTSLVTIFLIELLLFLGKYIFQVLVVGFLTVLGDHVFKPLMVALFNSLLQPLFIFMLNLFSSLRNLWLPIQDILRGIAQAIATVLKAFRLVEVHIGHTPSCPCTQVV